MPDKYDEAIAYLIEHPDEINDAWFTPSRKKGGCLFQFVTPNGKAGCNASCLTGIRNGGRGFTTELTLAISNDIRIPTSPDNIPVEILPVFAEWQRRIDRILNRNSSVSVVTVSDEVSEFDTNGDEY